ALVQDGFYPANQLYVTITKDENWTAADGHNHTTKEYKDKQGRVILKRTFANVGAPSVVEAHDTYYVYDRFGNLTYVIPPKVTTNDGVSESELSELCYQYKYDNRNRLIEKKIPGKDWEYIVYNKLDQPILTQDASLRKAMTGKAWDQWLFTKYDGFGRVVYTGTVINGANRKVIQNNVNNATTPQYESKLDSPITIGGTTVYYSKDAYPTSIYKVFTINYYDDYTFDLAGLTNPGTVYGETVLNHTKSLPTGSKVRVLDTNDWITTVTRYDNKARPIYIASKNEYLNTTDVIETKLDFIGKVEETTTRHKKGNNAEIVTIDTFTYDDMGRLLIQTQKINTQAVETIVENTYDALGQLERKKTGGGLQEVDYTYNVRGWLTKINDPNTTLGNKLFAFKINYNTPQHGATALFNGNISETTWKTANDNVERHYKYSYDALNRITDANYNSQDNSEQDWFRVFGITYDKNGNLKSLKRHKKGSLNQSVALDYLSYTYDSGNKLLTVEEQIDGASGFEDGTNTNDDYTYDPNGNMTIDQNKGITGITYNHLNLPKTVTVNNASHTGNITYIYDATGVKLKKITTEGSSSTTEYAGNYVYKNGTLEFFNHAEGIVEHEADGYKYVYQFKDHLGNIRLSYKDADKNGTITQSEIIEEKNYYPFGLQHKGYNNTITGREHPYKFNGIEHEQSLGLDLYEMPLRQYDPAIARWTSIDPITHHWQSTYSAFDGNPVFWADPSGASVEQTENGTTYTGENAKVEFLNLRNQYGDSGGTDPKKKKKKKSQKKDVKDMNAGEFYGMAYNGASRTAFLNGNDPYNPTEADIAQNEREKADAAGELILFVVGEWAVVKVLQGSAWIYRAIRVKNAVNITRAVGAAPRGFSKVVSTVYSSKALGGLRSTELGAQAFDKVNDIMRAMQNGDPWLYNEPIFTYLYRGQKYILDGHHRVSAAKKLNSSLEVIELPYDKAYQLFKSKVDDIHRGLFD
ncbi:RHS repeat-associated core domain-containing protein, partial [Aquimarina spinulae]